jgi:hypothetical protein
MKYRTSFVSNSSSASFLLGVYNGKKMSIDEAFKIVRNAWKEYIDGLVNARKYCLEKSQTNKTYPYDRDGNGELHFRRGLPSKNQKWVREEIEEKFDIDFFDLNNEIKPQEWLKFETYKEYEAWGIKKIKEAAQNHQYPPYLFAIRPTQNEEYIGLQNNEIVMSDFYKFPSKDTIYEDKALVTIKEFVDMLKNKKIKELHYNFLIEYSSLYLESMDNPSINEDMEAFEDWKLDTVFLDEDDKPYTCKFNNASWNNYRERNKFDESLPAEYSNSNQMEAWLKELCPNILHFDRKESFEYNNNVFDWYYPKFRWSCCRGKDCNECQNNIDKTSFLECDIPLTLEQKNIDSFNLDVCLGQYCVQAEDYTFPTTVVDKLMKLSTYGCNHMG